MLVNMQQGMKLPWQICFWHPKLEEQSKDST
ncbi:hypothetical protein RDABS01_033821 [Bienertia sinuspersici]